MAAEIVPEYSTTPAVYAKEYTTTPAAYSKEYITTPAAVQKEYVYVSKISIDIATTICIK